MPGRRFMAMVTVVLGAGACPAGAVAATGGGTFSSSTPAASTSAPAATTPTTPTTTTVTSANPPTGPSAGSGGQEFGTDDPGVTPVVAGSVALILPDGTAAAPALAPAPVQQAIWAANEIVGLPYVYGGGHRTFRVKAKGYDCSGTVSYALGGGDLLTKPRDSSALKTWGRSGAGKWITVYTRASHAYMTVAGIRLDTSAANDPTNAKGPRWRPLRPSNAGYVKRHPAGL